MKENKLLSLIAILIMYIIAGVVGFIIYLNLPFEYYWNLLLADMASTVVIFIFSLIFRNASCYDAYWSVAPIVIVFGYLFTTPFNVVRLLLSISVLLWGLRLTLNWIYTFDNLKWIDWRYQKLKDQTKLFYPIVNLVGIHMMPTIIVYLCILPLVYVFNNEVELSFFVIIFFITSCMSFIMQGIADMEMHKFRMNRNSTFIRNGLWKYSRHPNYLGEILMWWSIGLASVIALGITTYYPLLAGALANTLLFLFISIPLAENHQASRKEGFDEYKAQTRMLLPIYKRRKEKYED
ncbi:MAG: DUF1295 domain-containing protein [Acholeplasmatales bacterium]|nr:DUF1295 domain-containing protein [Acholeplasmatales bacterium]